MALPRDFLSVTLVRPGPYWVDANVGSNGEIGFAGSSANHPSELYYIPSLNDPPKRIADFNAELASRYIGRSEEIE
jgi:hypothetical protein